MEAVKSSIMSVYKISQHEADIFLSAFTILYLKKNDVFLMQGQECHIIGLIETGLMCCTIHKEEQETVFEFAYENSFIADYYSFVTHTRSEKSITCLEDTVIHVITRQHLYSLAAQHPFIQRISNINNQNLFLTMHNRLKSMLQDTATERYLQLVAARQDLANRIPQYLLASYLNVQPETISRIRRKIASGTLS